MSGSERPVTIVDLINKVMALGAENEALLTRMKAMEEQRVLDMRGMRSRWKHVREAIYRLECGSTGESWHTGGAYVMGSRLRWLPKPEILCEWDRMKNPRHGLSDWG